MLILPLVTGYFDARADFLVKYAPFHFEADIGITAGIRHTTDQAVTSSDTIIELSVQLQLYGPPVGGRAHIDFLLWHIPFDFGAEKAPPEPTTLTDFYNLVLQLKGSNVLEQGEAPPENQAHRFSCQAGLIVEESASNTESKEDAIWRVRAMPFSFLLSCSIPVKWAKAASKKEWPTPVYAKPLQIASPSTLDSTMEVSLTTVADTKTNLIGIMTMECYTSMVPKALWGECEFFLFLAIFTCWYLATYYSSPQIKMPLHKTKTLTTNCDLPDTPGTDPSISGNHISTLLNGSDPTSIELMTGLLISAPDAIPSDDPTFDLKQSPLEELEADDALPAPPASEHTVWLPAEESDDDPSSPDRWERARNAWKHPRWRMPWAVQPAVLELWLAAFGAAWGMSAQDRRAFGEDCGWGLMPEALYEGFDRLYLEAPKVASGESLV